MTSGLGMHEDHAVGYDRQIGMAYRWATRPLRLRFEMVMAVGVSMLILGANGRLFAQATDARRLAAASSADLVIVNGKLWTGKANPEGKFTAIAVSGDRIKALGDDVKIRAHVGTGTRVIDAGGRRVIPGITDSHTHMVSGGMQLGRLSLREAKNRQEFVDAVGAAAKAIGPGQWVLGGRWSVESWADPTQPTKEWIDAVTGDVPVLLDRMDGHLALANSAALRLAGIDKSGPKDPAGGEIVRDPKTQEPTGILKESAINIVDAKVPAASFDERYEGLRRAMEHANSFGITSVHDMSSPEDMLVFIRAHDASALTIRITSYLTVVDWPLHIDKVRAFPVHNDMLRVAGLKGYMDGSLGARTAYMKEPFADAGSDSKYPKGQLTAIAENQDSFRLMVANAQNHGMQLAVHAIGDQANHLLLDAYEMAASFSSRSDARNRIEHAQHLLVEDIPRFAKLGVVASMQPYHKADDGRYAEKALGAERLKGSYAFRQLVESGALLCFGSDFPVVTLNPFLGIDAAVNAKTLDGKVWLQGHSLTLEQALTAYTVSPPKAVHRGENVGTLEVDKLADIVILADDPFAMPVEQVGSVKVWQTIMGGKVVYSKAN